MRVKAVEHQPPGSMCVARDAHAWSACSCAETANADMQNNGMQLDGTYTAMIYELTGALWQHTPRDVQLHCTAHAPHGMAYNLPVQQFI